MSMAAITRAAGLYAQIPDNTTAKEHEHRLDKQFLGHGLCRLASAREVVAADAWVVTASDPIDAEQVDIAIALRCV